MRFGFKADYQSAAGCHPAPQLLMLRIVGRLGKLPPDEIGPLMLLCHGKLRDVCWHAVLNDYQIQVAVCRAWRNCEVYLVQPYKARTQAGKSDVCILTVHHDGWRQ